MIYTIIFETIAGEIETMYSDTAINRDYTIDKIIAEFPNKIKRLSYHPIYKNGKCGETKNVI